MGSVDANHKDSGQRGYLDGHPHKADIVRKQGEVHREQQNLVHGVIKTKMGRGQPAGRKLVANVTGAEQARSETNEGVERNEDDVEIIHKEV